MPDGNTKRQSKPNSAVSPVLDRESLLAGVEGNVGKGTLRVVVRRRQLGAGGREAAAGDRLAEDRRSKSAGGGDHFDRVERVC